MANLLKYSAVNWAEGTPIAGERLASNALYTGEQVGAVMQDTLKSKLTGTLTLSSSAYAGDKQVKINCESGNVVKGDTLKIKGVEYTVTEDAVAQSNVITVKVEPKIPTGGLAANTAVEHITYNKAPHFVEESVLHFGTIMHDAADTNFPKVANT